MEKLEISSASTSMNKPDAAQPWLLALETQLGQQQLRGAQGNESASRGVVKPSFAGWVQTLQVSACAAPELGEGFLPGRTTLF